MGWGGEEERRPRGLAFFASTNYSAWRGAASSLLIPSAPHFTQLAHPGQTPRAPQSLAGRAIEGLVKLHSVPTLPGNRIVKAFLFLWLGWRVLLMHRVTQGGPFRGEIFRFNRHDGIGRLR